HDNWEPLTKDWNKNGEFDFAPHIKLTVSRYLLPSGRSIHRELDKEGNIVPGHRGGIDPDVAVDGRTYEVWRIEEMQRLQKANKIRDYVDEHWAANQDLFTKLAENDQRETSRYPEFDAFMAKLATPIPADDVRQLIRMELRRRVQDMRGKEFPGGDFVEDVQLQEAIRVALEKLGRTPGEFPEYKSAIPPTTRGRVQIAKIERQSLEETLAQLKLAKTSDGKLSPEVIERLQEMLQASLDGGDGH
ncbi:MAG TPA: hypothetical protein VM509_11780, partial [Planctomycetota bacterium]|nr:hypothetical protein [Planctomycetota bacterium]